MMGHREKMKSGDEYDMLTRWRDKISQSRHKSARVKASFNRRIRKEAKAEIMRDLEWN